MSSESAEHGEPVPLHLVCAQRPALSTAVQHLRDFLRERCAVLDG